MATKGTSATSRKRLAALKAGEPKRKPTPKKKPVPKPDPMVGMVAANRFARLKRSTPTKDPKTGEVTEHGKDGPPTHGGFKRAPKPGVRSKAVRSQEDSSQIRARQEAERSDEGFARGTKEQQRKRKASRRIK